MTRFLLIALTGLLTVGAAAPAAAFGPLDIEAELPLYSKYVWRGINAVDDYVLQPHLQLGVLGFGLDVWGNMELTDINENSGEFTEVNYTVAYGFGFPFIDLGLGFIRYEYPKIDGYDTTEFYLSGKVNVILSPTLVFYQDIDRFKGAYWAASIGHGFGVGEDSQIDLGAGLGLGSESYLLGYFPVDPELPWNPEFSNGASSTDYFIDLRWPFHPVPFFTVTPSVTWTSLLGDAKRSVDAVPDDSVFSGKTGNFYWGLSVLFRF